VRSSLTISRQEELGENPHTFTWWKS
jgi:hypothetical protein